MENLNEKKQIEEMAEYIFGNAITHDTRFKEDCRSIAIDLYTAGYRKQSDGEWVEKAKCGVSIKGYMVCSVCDVMIPACDADGDYYCLSRLDYCPRCGAKMKGGEQG